MQLKILTLITILAAGCSAAGGATPTGSPGGPGTIEHRTGPADVLLRFEESGGFVAPAFLATQAPTFTLYGDGTVIARNPAGDPLPPIGSVSPSRPFRVTHLSEDEIQDLLADALGRGGLRAARTDYPSNQVADAPTAVFTVNAGGITKSVSIYALGIDVEGLPDALARAAFVMLVARLEGFDNAGEPATTEYAADRYRGILLDGQAVAPDATTWPWTDIAPADFVTSTDPNAFQLPTGVLTIAEVEALGITPYGGGFQGLSLVGPGNGRTYTFSVRPLLPDEVR